MTGTSRDTHWMVRACLQKVLTLFLSSAIGVFATAQSSSARPAGKEQKSAAPAFSEADAAGLLAEVQQALEGNNQRRFLKLFDAARMPNYASFQDQVAEFFEKYESSRMRYHITQTSAEGELGIVVADLELEVTPTGAYVQVRKNAQLRLVAAWDGKRWRIVDWAPRSVLS